MLIPRYGSRSLAEVLPSIAHALGDHGHDNALGFSPIEHAVLLVIDGMGWDQVVLEAEQLPVLGPAMAEQVPVDAAFPTTTPAGLATLTLGMPPGRHGFVGATFLLPDFECVLSPLHWDDDPHPAAVQPEPTVFERSVGFTVHRHGPAKYAQTGMTRSLLAGAEAHDHEDFDPQVIVPRRRHLDYVYLPKLDKLGHVHGANTPKWRAYLQRLDALVDELRQRLPSSASVFITSDHGMVTIPDDHRIDVDIAAFAEDVEIMAGEPRMRHLYTAHATAVRDRWGELLGDRAHVLLRDEVVRLGLYGEVDPALLDRVGDVVAIARDTWVMASQRVDPRTSMMRGVHGALTPAELRVPALEIRGVA